MMPTMSAASTPSRRPVQQAAGERAEVHPEVGLAHRSGSARAHDSRRSRALVTGNLASPRRSVKRPRRRVSRRRGSRTGRASSSRAGTRRRARPTSTEHADDRRQRIARDVDAEGRGEPERRLPDRQELGPLEQPGQDALPDQDVGEAEQEGPRGEHAERHERDGVRAAADEAGDREADDRRRRVAPGCRAGSPVSTTAGTTRAAVRPAATSDLGQGDPPARRSA